MASLFHDFRSLSVDTVTARENDSDVRVDGFQLLNEFAAVGSRHDHIQNDQIDISGIPAVDVQGIRPGFCGKGRVSQRFQKLSADIDDDVLIVDQDWTPANLNQAEDRVHRIGQDEAVTATHLVADLPIDRKLRAVVEAKQAICDAVAQGAVGLDDATDSAVVSAVIDALLADAPQASAAPAA